MIYVVRCEGDLYYVGKSERGSQRIMEHLAEQGCEWTRAHKPVEVVEQLEGDGFIEDAVTKRYMAEHGLDRVRGGSYCTMELPIGVKQLLIRELRGSTDCCFNCGLIGHFVQDCPTKARSAPIPVPSAASKERAKPCGRCGRRGHSCMECFASTHIDGKFFEGPTCKRCARDHKTNKCYAKRDLDGNVIEQPPANPEMQLQNQPPAPPPKPTNRQVGKPLPSIPKKPDESCALL
jgi:hypothetical protein